MEIRRRSVAMNTLLAAAALIAGSSAHPATAMSLPDILSRPEGIKPTRRRREDTEKLTKAQKKREKRARKLLRQQSL